MLIGNFPLGTVITFRYTSPGAHDRFPMVLVLTSRHRDGNMHAINLRYLSPIHQQQLQYYFKTPNERQSVINPFKQQRIEDYQDQQEEQEKQEEAEEQEEKESGVVVKPQPGNTFGVSTFTTTARKVVQSGKTAFGRLRKYLPFGGREEPPGEPMERIPPLEVLSYRQTTYDPYTFYNRYVKSLLGSYVSNSYRKYKPMHIHNARIVKSVSVI